MTWGGGYFTTWSRKRQRYSQFSAVTSSGMTREEVEQRELEIWEKMASTLEIEGEKRGTLITRSLQ